MKIIVLADLHFGAKQRNAHIYECLVKVVYPFIVKNDPDLIVIAGDDTDDRLSFDQESAKYYLKFVWDIAHFYHRNKEPVAVRWISGTESHQRRQLGSLRFIVDDTTVNVKTFETVCEEKFNGKAILYIPEETITTSKEEFYRNTLFSGKKYDWIFGHGSFDFLSFAPNQEKSLRGSPVFSTEEIKNCVVNCAVFGHYHIRQNHRNVIYYPGSLTRFAQGEDEPKGFIFIHNSNVEFVENPLARKYITFSLSKEKSIEPVEELIKFFIGKTNAKTVDDVRILVNRHNIEISKLEELKGYFKKHPEFHIRFEIQKEKICDNVETKHGNDENMAKTIMAERFPEIKNPQDWIFNTLYFVKENFQKTLSKESVENILTKARSFAKKS